MLAELLPLNASSRALIEFFEPFLVTRRGGLPVACTMSVQHILLHHML